ncbi:MAG TPA: DNA helicase RecQ [Bacteroidales bacterium]|nr:DNA helicase RecQ [Bacteroidales bacterium]
MPVRDAVALHDLLKQIFGFDQFKGNQEEIIRSVLDGHDTFVIMPTGGGKSMCYQLPALISPGTAIIISPLIALMKNQVDAIRNFHEEAGVAHFLNSSLTKGEITQVKEDLLSGTTKLLYVAPESLTKQENVDFLKDIDIGFYAIDEAHCISEWGHDFRPEYRRLRPIIEAIGKQVPIIALTATATPKVQLDIQKNLKMMDARVFKSSFNRPNLYYEVRPKSKDVIRDIIRYIKGHTGKSGIVYCLSRKKVEEVAEVLQVNGIKALPYHAGLDSLTRVTNQDKFLMEEADVIVATIAFGMGIDKPDVRFVIHHDIPKSLEGYYQETGRAGRDGGEGNCVSFYSYDDVQKLEKFMKGKPVAEQEIAQQLLLETVAYAESSLCRRKLLLHYFGETYPKESCENCDNCNNPREKFDGQDHICKVLEAILEVRQQFKAAHIIHIVMGNGTTQIRQYRHHQLQSFGSGSKDDEKVWNAVIRQAMIAHLIVKDIDNYGLLKVSPEGHRFLENPWPVMVTRDHDYDNPEEDEFESNGVAKGANADMTLFAMLKDLRRDISRRENLPPFVIFQDPSLEDMAILYPVNAEELTQCTGVGSGKARKYGEPFLQLIREYVEENDIIRPNDLVVKSVVNKSGLKVFIIQSIDRKLDLEDIADSKDLSLEEVIQEIESIVASGTRIDIDYYIAEAVDPYHLEDIYEYFREAETDSVEQALEELGADEYTETEIRLVRIKFMSEIGN